MFLERELAGKVRISMGLSPLKAPCDWLGGPFIFLSPRESCQSNSGNTSIVASWERVSSDLGFEMSD